MYYPVNTASGVPGAGGQLAASVALGAARSHTFNPGGAFNATKDATRLLGKPFVVKIQAALTGSGPLMLYNSDRSFSCFIPEEDACYAKLIRAMRVPGLFGGVKAYFWAKLDDAMQLSVAADTPAPAQSW